MTAGAERRQSARLPKESRHRAREAALQMLYQWEVGRVPMDAVGETFWGQDTDAGEPLAHDLRAFALGIANGVVARVDEIDPLIGSAAEHWRVERMNVMDRLVLRLAVYEFLHEPGTPAKVVINEALELARTFSGDESVRFVNGVLDGIRRTLRRE